jgi:hypothetical protein
MATNATAAATTAATINATTAATTAAATTVSGASGTERVSATNHYDADGTAVAAFILGLLGTFVFNVVFGPLALVLGAVALIRGTRRRGRAALGIALGLADLSILAALIATHQGVIWTPGF